MPNQVKRTSQYMDNMSFDETYNQNTSEMLVENAEGTALVRQKPIATEAKQDDIISGQYPAGAGTNGTLTLTSANTAYSITTGAGKSVLIVHNGSDADVYFGFATLTSGGILLPAGGTATLDLGASQSVYFYCDLAGKVINYSYKLTE